MDTKTKLDLSVEVAPHESSALATKPLLGTRKSLSQLEASTEHYPEPIRENVRWVQGFFFNHCKGNVQALRAIGAKVAPKLDRSREYWSNLITGYYFNGGSGDWKQGGKAWSEFLELVVSLRRYEQQAVEAGRVAFVQTPTYRCISDFILQRMALETVCKFGGITGPTGSQKSASLKFFRTLNNHGRVIHIEAPARNRLPALQTKIGKGYNVKPSVLRLASTREDAIRENVNETRCIIIDNVQRLYDDDGGSDQPCFDWLLELQDDTGCTIILSFTTDFVDKLTAGRAKGYFEQFIGRMGGRKSMLQLPDYTPASDLRVIARSFDLEPGKGAMEQLTDWSREDGRVRIVFDRLQLAREIAREDGRTNLTLADLTAANEYTPPAIGSDDDDEGGAL